MAIGWPYSVEAWLSRRRLTRARRKTRRRSGTAGLKVRTPLALAFVLTLAYGGSWIFLLRSSLPVQNPAEVEEQLSCLALNIYHEARGEPGEGKLAVGHVVMNRVEDARFPASVCEVGKQGGWKRRARCQFSWWCDGRPDDPSELPAWEDSLYHARQVLWRATEDPTSGALWYHADHVAPSWRKQMIKGPKIGKHIFYRGRSRG